MTDDVLLALQSTISQTPLCNKMKNSFHFVLYFIHRAHTYILSIPLENILLYLSELKMKSECLIYIIFLMSPAVVLE